MFPRSLLFTALVLAYFAYWTAALPAQKTFNIRSNDTVHGQHQHHAQHLVGTNHTRTHSSEKKKKGGKGRAKSSNQQNKSETNQEQQSTSSHLFLPRSRFCGQKDSTNATVNAMAKNVTASFRKELQAKSRNSGRGALQMVLANTKKQVDVAFHVIHDGSDGNLSRSDIDGQISEMNKAYGDYGFSFEVSNVTRTDNRRWYRGVTSGNSLQTDMKKALYQGNASTLNMYTVAFPDNLLGYSTFPFDNSAGSSDDGVVFLYSTVPGGSEQGYNQGKTAVHEVGHWLGLLHVFQGGCGQEGDSVDDTPPQQTATAGCPTNQDSCPGGGVDSVHNYMDYSADACMNQFTEGQAVRMAALTSQYRRL